MSINISKDAYVESLASQKIAVGNVADWKNKVQNDTQQDSVSQVDAASVTISDEGAAALAKQQSLGNYTVKELTPVAYTFHDVYAVQKEMYQGITIDDRVSGDFTDQLAANYQAKYEQINQDYADDDEERQRQQDILDEAFQGAVTNESEAYVSQLQSFVDYAGTISYANDEEAEQGQIDLENHRTISQQDRDTLVQDVIDICYQTRDAAAQQSDQTDQIKGKLLSYFDIHQLGNYFMGITDASDLSGMGDYAQYLSNI